MRRKLTGDHCQCTACGEYFNSTRAFDKHRIGDYGMRRCRTPDVMLAVGMALSSTGWWLSRKHSDSSLPRVSGGGDHKVPATSARGAT